MMIPSSQRERLLLTVFAGMLVFAGMFFFSRVSPSALLGRVLEGEELLRVQAESDFDQDGDVDFLDFTVFAALYEEEA